MKSASFVILSLVLHAAALVYPVSFYLPNRVQLIDVSVLPMEQEKGDAGSRGGNGDPARRGDSKSHRATPRAVEPRFESTTSNPEPQALPAETVAKVGDNSVTLVAAIANFQETGGSATRGSIGNDTHGYGSGGTGGETGTGSGRGSGNGPGSSGTGIALTQARYRDTLKPDYPESARRDSRAVRV